MSLPLMYSNVNDYLKDALAFLGEYQWIYNFQNTHILAKDIFSYFPSDWFEFFKNLPNEELNKLPVNELKNCPISLEILLGNISNLRPNVDRDEIFEDNYIFSHNSGLSEKKRHEIVTLAPLINKVCNNLEINLIIDVGSGLGYLSHYLNLKYGYKVLGIECSKQNVDMAFKNQQKLYPNSKNQVLFSQHYINTDSSEFISALVKDNFSSVGLKSSSLVGLHACADLSINIFDIFSELDFIKCLVIMPCCYHRIDLENSTEDEENFLNFPKSTILKDLFIEYGAQTFLRRPFLRLSCQQTIGHYINMSKQEHENHSKNLMFRCILQKVAETEKLNVNRLKRKSNTTCNSQDSDEDFENYLKNLHHTHRLLVFNSVNEEIDISDSFLEKMRALWREYKEKCYLIEALTGLQAAIQSICENVILHDRIEYLKEKGFNCVVKKVTDDILSPRCYALIATKD